MIEYFIDKEYHMVHNQYVEHVHVGSCTIRKRVFPIFETRPMASTMPPVGDTNTKLQLLNRADGTMRGDVAPPFAMVITCTARWLNILCQLRMFFSGYKYMAIIFLMAWHAADADKRKGQRVGQL